MLGGSPAHEHSPRRASGVAGSEGLCRAAASAVAHHQPLSAPCGLSCWVALQVVTSGLALSFTLKPVGCPQPAAGLAVGCRETPASLWSPWAAGEYLLRHLELLIPLRLGAHRAVSHTFYLIPHSCEVFCPFLTCYHRGTAVMSLAMLCCGAMVGLLCPAQGSPDLSSQRPSCSTPQHP